MTHKEIRSQFFDFFESRGHKLLPAASLVPDNDPSVLFTVAGMQQFKTYYQHPETAPAARVVTIQPCIRTIDINEVGDDTHLTTFEMMGNFSFGYTGKDSPTGAYFKEESIKLSWQFLTESMKIAKSRITATYFAGDDKREEDTESKEALNSLEGLSLVEAAGEDNFWGPVGDEGPCGPTIEFYVDGVEIWNNVFNEYYRDCDSNYAKADSKGVDTGMGLERLVAVIQDKKSVYETDMLAPLVTVVTKASDAESERQIRIIVDHTKAAVFLLADGIKAGNKGRDYILRRLIRRAVRAAQLIGFDDFDNLIIKTIDIFAPYKSTVADNKKEILDQFKGEQFKFLRTIKDGTKQLKAMLGQEKNGEISGDQAFKLFDTYGFPIELTQEIAEEAGWTVDITDFESHFARHREQSRQSQNKIFHGGLADQEPQTVAHHTAHHLLLAALREILGSHVVQRGSNITADRLRIDVSHPEKISPEELKMAETIVNQKIDEDLPIVNETMDRDEAIRSGALAEFGAKYPDQVSVYTIIDQDGGIYSRELCGGPHVTSSGELGHFEIIKEEASGAGIRRIRARLTPK